MSFSALTARSNNDRDPRFFGQGYEELGADFFDQFLTFSPVEDAHDYTSLAATLFQEGSASNSSSAEDTSSNSLNGQGRHHNAHDPWRSQSWTFTQSAAEKLKKSRLYSESTGRAATSDSELLSLEGISLQSPTIPTSSHLSLPSSPKLSTVVAGRKRSHIVESLSKSFKKASVSKDCTLRGPIRRKSSASPKTIRTYPNQKADILGKKLNLDTTTFEFDFENMGSVTPRLSQRFSDAAINTNATVSSAVQDLDANLRFNDDENINVTNSLDQFVKPANYQTPETPPLLDSRHSRNSSLQHLPDSNEFPRTPQLQHASPLWSQVSCPDYSPYSNGSQLDGTPLWWNHADTAPMAQPSPSAFYTNSQRATKSLALQLQNGLAYNTNGLVCTPSDLISGLEMQISQNAHQQSFNSSPRMQQSFISDSNSPRMQQSFNPNISPRTQQDHFPSNRARPNGQHFQRPRQRYAQVPFRQSSQSRPQAQHPQMSPKQRNPRSGSSCSSSKSPSSQAYHVQKRKAHRQSKKDTQGSPGIGGSSEFVNYTPSDSRKILTGVAPSGSSKTKARREKEALERRRKLSLAAVRAVRAAGGDVERLVEEGLMI
ncbi:hypothetical protein B7494_g7915 [Chlorociboria aeruginascens]|nr:hypothetical protein B7494_g7915 [Chlorociboria aeruginascens]